MTDSRQQLARLVILQQVRVESAERLLQQTHAEAVVQQEKVAVARQHLLRAEQRRCEHQMKISSVSNTSASDLVRNEQYLARLSDQLEQREFELKAEQSILVQHEARLVEVKNQLRKARARLDALKVQQARVERELKRKQERKDEGRMEELAMSRSDSLRVASNLSTRETIMRPSEARVSSVRIESLSRQRNGMDSCPQPEALVDRFRALMEGEPEAMPKGEAPSQDEDEMAAEADKQKGHISAQDVPEERSDEGLRVQHQPKADEDWQQRNSDDQTSQQKEPHASHELEAAVFLSPLSHFTTPMMSTLPQAAATDADLINLMEQHVRQFLTNDLANTPGAGGQVMLKLSESSLFGSDLSLTRTNTGWSLQATVADQRALDLIRRAAPKLVARFSERGLGILEVAADADTSALAERL